MKLRGIDYGSVWDAAGVRGMLGEGQRFHPLFKLLFPGFFTFKGVTFVSKTVTWKPNAGNMPLRKDGLTPRELFPKCIIVDIPRAFMLNAVGLSNFGARFYFDKGVWQSSMKPSVISFMAISETKSERMAERRAFVREMKIRLPSFNAPVAIQENFSCPNVGHNLDELFGEIWEGMAIFAELDIPYIPKFNILVPPERVLEVAKDKRVDAVCVSNTIPFGELPEWIDWKKLFGSSTRSPLEERGFGKGGLSGAPIWPAVHDWVKRYGKLVPPIPLIAGGGLMCCQDVYDLTAIPCVECVQIGSVATLRPHRLNPMVKTAYRCLRMPYK